jgi:hypothetical protein
LQVEIDKESISIPQTEQKSEISTARKKRVLAPVPLDTNSSKPVSARSNNLEVWLSKKKALDQQSQSRSSR